MALSRITKEAARQGVAPGIIATLCCLGPLLLVTLGMVSVSSALVITTYAPYFIPAGLAVLAVSLWYAIRKRRAMICHGCENKGQERKRLIMFALVSIVIAAATYLLVFYLLLPWLAPIVVNNFAGK